jgi:hypothetical protein
VKRRGFLRTALAMLAGAAVAVPATWATVKPIADDLTTPPRTTAGPLRPPLPRIERYGWVDAYGNEVIGYRKILPGTPDYTKTTDELNWGCR